MFVLYSKTGYTYSLLHQSEQANLMGDVDDDDEEAGNLERDLDKALSSKVRYEDSEDEVSLLSVLFYYFHFPSSTSYKRC